MNTLSRGACWFGGVLLTLGAALGGDWPQFKRDAARTGDAPDEALTWPMQRVTAVRFPSPIYASPAVVDGHVYVQDARGHVASIDAARNTVLWVTEIGGVANHSSPAVAEGKVFVGSSAGHLAVLDARTGALLRKIPGEGGIITSPALANGAVYFSTLAGQLHKVDYAGKALWTFGGATGSCHEFAVRDDLILFFGRAEQVGPPYRESTVRLFFLRDRGNAVEVLASPWAPLYPTSGMALVSDTMCAYQSWRAEEGTPYLVSWDAEFKLKARGASTSSGHWDGRAVPSCRAGRVFFARKSGVLSWDVDGKSGGEWSMGAWPGVAAAGFESSPALSKDHLAIGNNAGQLILYPLDPAKQGNRPPWAYQIGALAAAGRVNGGIVSSPAVSGGRVYFGGEDGVLYGLGQGPEVAVVDAVKDGRPHEWPGKRLAGAEWVTVGGDMGFSFVSPDTGLRPPFNVKWRARIWGVRKSGPIVAAGRVFVSGRSGQLTALDAETGEILWNTHHPNALGFCAPTCAEGKVLVYREPMGSDRNQSGLWCHDAQTGTLVWHVPGPHPTAVYGSAAEGLVAHQGKVFAARHDGAGGLRLDAYALADGKEVWTRQYADLTPLTEKATAVVNQGAIGDGRWFCSFNALTAGRPPQARKAGATLAVNPDNGDILWKNTEVYIDGQDRLYMGRVSYRQGTVVVFQQGTGGVALSAADGRRLWKGAAIPGYAVPLSDAFLTSQGRSGISSGAYCGAHAFANGFWYGQSTFNSAVTVGRTMTGTPPQLTDVWSWLSMGRSCAGVALAYGRLYLCTNEGVVYCFENAQS
jgi:outer membrane protein assembly factor BamB